MQDGKRMIASSNRKLDRLPSATKRSQPTLPPAQLSPFPIKPEDIDKASIKAFASVNEIQRYLDNPQLINVKSQPSKLLDTQNNYGVGGIWRNAYYLSTSIEETNIRKQPAKSMSQIEFPQSYQQLSNQDQMSPTATHQNEGLNIEKQHSYYMGTGNNFGGNGGSRPQSAITSSQGNNNN